MELRSYFYNAYGCINEWPKTFEVSPALYGKICQHLFDKEEKEMFWDVVKDGKPEPWLIMKTVMLGQNRGLMFMNVELIIKKESEPLVEPRTKAGSLD